MNTSFRQVGQFGRGTSHLSPDALRSLRGLLVSERAHHLEIVRDHSARGPEPLEDGVNVDREIAETLAAQSTAVLEDIEHALERMEAGTYGTCVACERTIPFERLEAIPYTRFCVSCQALPRMPIA